MKISVTVDVEPADLHRLLDHRREESGQDRGLRADMLAELVRLARAWAPPPPKETPS